MPIKIYAREGPNKLHLMFLRAFVFVLGLALTGCGARGATVRAEALAPALAEADSPAIPAGERRVQTIRKVAVGLRDAGGALWLGSPTPGGDGPEFNGVLELWPNEMAGALAAAAVLAACPVPERPETCTIEQLQRANQALHEGRERTHNLRFTRNLEDSLGAGDSACLVEGAEGFVGRFRCRGDKDRQLQVEHDHGALLVDLLGTGWRDAGYEGLTKLTLYPGSALQEFAPRFERAAPHSDLGSAAGLLLSSPGAPATGVDSMLGIADRAVKAAGFDASTISMNDAKAIVAQIYMRLLACQVGGLRTPESERCDRDSAELLAQGAVEEVLTVSVRLWLCGQSVKLDAVTAHCRGDHGSNVPAAEMLAPLRHLRALAHLRLSEFENSSGVGLDSLEPVAALPQLQTLDVEWNGINDIAPLRALSQLKGLKLTGNPVRDLEPILALPDLTVLSLAATAVHALPDLSGWRSLEGLNLSQTAISDLRPLRSLPALRSLRLLHSGQVGGRPLSLEGLRGMTTLVELVLDESRLTDMRVLGSLTGLHKLRLRNVDLRDASWLSALTQLENLDLGNNPLRDVAVLGSLGQLRELDLGQTKVQRLAPLATLVSLERLDLSSLVAPDLAAIAKLPRLRALTLRSAKQVDLAPVVRMEQLEELDLTGATFTNFVVICQAKQLRKLNLRNVEKIDFTALARCAKLEELTVDDGFVDEVNALRERLPNLRVR